MKKTYYCPKSCELKTSCPWKSGEVNLTSEPEDANFTNYCPFYLNQKAFRLGANQKEKAC